MRTSRESDRLRPLNQVVITGCEAIVNVGGDSNRELAALQLLRDAGFDADDTVPAADLAALADIIDAIGASDVNAESGGLEVLLPAGIHLNVKTGVWNALVALFSMGAASQAPHITWVVFGNQFLQAANKIKDSFHRLSPGQENLYATVAEITARKRRAGTVTDGAYADEIVKLMNERERPGAPYLEENITPFLDELATKAVFVCQIDAAQRSFYRPVL